MGPFVKSFARGIQALLRWIMTRTLILAVLLGIGFLGYLYHTLPDVTFLKYKNPTQTAFIKQKGGRQMQFWVDYYDISENLKKAVLVSEDYNFFYHNGVDAHEVKESMLKNIKRHSWSRGASTITMQLAKNLYLSPDKTLFRKFKEFLLTHKLERALSKVRIFEIYLNVIEWGRGIYGVEAAAHHYFQKSARYLSPEEAAYLAAIIPNPNLFTQVQYMDIVIAKRNLILNRMEKFSLPP